MSKLRVEVFAVCGVVTVLAALLIVQLYNPPPTEALGQTIARGVSAIVGACYAVFVLPALLLAFLDRWLYLALAMALLAVPAALLALQFA